MKKLLTISFVAFSCTAFAQSDLPALSPEGKIFQNVGYVNFEINYGRPVARGRKIFGELVPFGEVWRTGGGSSTKISFDKPVTIASKTLPAGTYSLVTIPDTTHWVVMLNSNTKKIFGAQQDDYDKETEVLRFKVPVQLTDQFYESFTINLDIVYNDAELYMQWANTQIHFTLYTNSNAQALQYIEEYFSQNPINTDLGYVAYYLRMNNQDLQLVHGYIDRALQIKKDIVYYELKMKLLVEAGLKDEAKKIYKVALDYLQKSKPDGWQETEKHLKRLANSWR